MAVFGTEEAKVLMPRNIADGMVTEARTSSTVAQLSAREPQRFGETEYIVFNDFPRAEFVEEGAQKSHTTGGFTSVTAKPHKAQVTLRFNQEVQWASEDYQLQVFRDLADAGKLALARALDLGLYHRINPLSGEVISAWDNYVGATTLRAELAEGAEADQVIRSAVGLLVNRDRPTSVNGLALDPRLTWALSELQTKLANGDPSGQQRYPQLGFGAAPTSFAGINAAQGDTVSGQPEAAADTGVRGIVGDFQNGIRWGVQRDLPVELIRFGDPDGQGDLKRHNQIALRLEIVYGWYVFANRFAVIEEPAAETGTGA
ncbi:phage major capsid protein [Nesterenkonia sp.]|uniref:phage major capsid family protein n=1 Tax=Nesterenkonia sp. TaxID=704201 RepID=UPI00260BCC95|nr:phage major capsid protein [Nesterenkonia sp.]